MGHGPSLGHNMVPWAIRFAGHKVNLLHKYFCGAFSKWRLHGTEKETGSDNI